MLDHPSAAAPAAATLPLFLPQAPPDKVSGLIHAATLLGQLLGQGRAIDTRALRSAMEAAFGATDAEGAWAWKDAYEALEAAQVLFLRKFGAAMRTRAGSAAAMLEMLTRLAGRLASQTRRSEESEHFQQFSTPLALGFVASEAAALTPADFVLEPSAGTGLLAIFVELARARLALNEIADTRAGLLGRLFRDVAVTRHNAEQIDDRLDPKVRPSVVLMNPPFSASPHVEGRFAEAAMRHVSSAFARLAEGGRLVAITGHNVGPDQPAWREAFVRLQEKGRVVFTATISGKAYVRHGTSMETRLTVIDRVPAEDPRAFPPSPGLCRRCRRIARPGFSPGAAASAGHRGFSPPRPGRVSGAHARTAESFHAAAHAPQTPASPPGCRRTRLRDLPVATGRIRPAFSDPLRGLRAAGDADSRRAAPSDQARAVGGHGRGRPSPPVLSAAFAAAPARGRRLVRRAARERRLCRRGACRPSCRLLHGRRHLRRRLGCPGRRPRRGPFPPRLVPRRRHRCRQGPPGRGHHSRQLAQGPTPRAVDLQIRQADRGCRARLDRGWRLPLRHRAAIALSSGRCGRARRRASSSPLTRPCAPRRVARSPAACSRSSTGSAATPDRGPGQVSTASSCSTRRTPWPTPPATKASAARRNRRSRARPGCACKTHCTMRASSTSRRPAPRRCRTSPMRLGSGSGAPVTFRSRRGPISCRRWKAAASPRWRCWLAI